MDIPFWDIRRLMRAVRVWLWWMVCQDTFYPSLWYQLHCYRRPVAEERYMLRHGKERLR